jgi:riboflavin synthase
MFTGIVENLATVVAVTNEKSNIHFDINSSLANDFKIDQSIAHDGCCLTVIALNKDQNQKITGYRVTAINETLQKTTLQYWRPGSMINIERCTKVGSRLDGHIVQGHIDCTAVISDIVDQNGSWEIKLKHELNRLYQTVNKGSITINGISLTVVESGSDYFSVAIIPYTWNNTSFHLLKIADQVNLEFDIIGKYVSKILEAK